MPWPAPRNRGMPGCGPSYTHPSPHWVRKRAIQPSPMPAGMRCRNHSLLCSITWHLGCPPARVHLLPLGSHVTTRGSDGSVSLVTERLEGTTSYPESPVAYTGVIILIPAIRPIPSIQCRLLGNGRVNEMTGPFPDKSQPLLWPWPGPWLACGFLCNSSAFSETTAALLAEVTDLTSISHGPCK